MPETRYLDTYQNGVLVSHEPYEISDGQLADEAEEGVFAKVDEIINGIDSLPKAREFLRRLCKRLVSKGYLP